MCPQGRVFFDIPLTEVPKVLELRIVDNAFVIVHVIPKIEFPKKKAGLSEKDLDPEAQKGTVVGIQTTLFLAKFNTICFDPIKSNIRTYLYNDLLIFHLCDHLFLIRCNKWS